MAYITEGLVNGVMTWVLIDEEGHAKITHKSWWKLNVLAERHGYKVETVH